MNNNWAEIYNLETEVKELTEKLRLYEKLIGKILTKYETNEDLTDFIKKYMEEKNM